MMTLLLKRFSGGDVYKRQAQGVLGSITSCKLPLSASSAKYDSLVKHWLIPVFASILSGSDVYKRQVLQEIIYS